MVNMQDLINFALILAIIAGVFVAVQLLRGNLWFWRHRSYGRACADVRRERRRNRNRAFAMERQVSTPLAFVLRILVRMRGAA